ncbi:MAG: hypothetical protein U5L45_01525 [Saprospiraceae bacterium]|nr:hypothetical protein [Saprospiraceae bacterium]
MVRFSAKPKNEPHSPPSRERSEREMQKTLLGYARPSIKYLIKCFPLTRSVNMFIK